MKYLLDTHALVWTFFETHKLSKTVKSILFDSGSDIYVSSINYFTYHQLTAQYHKDPFDRMLIWQAISNRYTLISDDDNVKNYTSEGLKVIW